MKLLRAIIITLVQFVVVTALVVGGCIAWTLNDRGISYAETVAFREDLVQWAQIGMVVAGLFCLVMVCFRMTVNSLDGPDDGWHY